MPLENSIAGQRCVHIHATLDTELLKPDGKDVHHLSNMMVFHKPANNSHQKHTGLKARRHNSGTQLKAVVNLKDVNTAGLEFLGVTRDHLVDGESALRHPSSAGMFAVCIDGVVTIRAPFAGNSKQLVPGDFLCIASTAAAEPIEGTEKRISTFALKKAEATATVDPEVAKEKPKSGFTYDTWTSKPIGRLVEMRNTPVDGVKEFRVNLCPFGAPYAMLDTGVNPKDQNEDNIKGLSIENDPFNGYALTYLDYGAIQPTKREASADFTPNAAIFGTIAVQGRTGASQAMTGIIEQDETETAAEKAHPTYEEWAESAHGKSVSAQARDFVQQAATSSNAKASVFINHEGEARLIENATDFRKNVLSTANEHRTIQQGDTTVSIYAAGRKRSAQTSSSAATKKSRSRK